MKRQLTIKPTCMREIVAFPSDRVPLLWEKVDQLLADPTPDGKVKKKLKGAEGVYRLRVGDHRVFYRFGEDWVSLLGVRRRQEDTYRAIPDGGPGALAPDDAELDLDQLDGPPVVPSSFRLAEDSAGRALPRELGADWLRGLGVPGRAIPALLRCKTEDDLLEAPVPAEALARVLDALFPPDLQTLARQPDLVVPSPEHLVRYKEGDLLGFLLRLDGDQRKLVRWALAGPTMVRGGAGTGKSTVALYRVKELLERPGATGRERVLFTTYTRALLTATRQLLEQLLTPEQLARVTVATCDRVAFDIVRSRRAVGEVESDGDTLRRLASLRRTFVPGGTAFESALRARALARLSDAYLLEEFDWILDGRALSSLDAYLSAPRPGRGVAFSERTRAVVWELYEAFTASAPAERYPALRREALSITGQERGPYDYVLVDEAQDLSPVGLALLAEVCATPEGLFFAADTKQSLYAKGYTWSSAHPRLQFRGRTALLQRNYRSTAEIDRAAFTLLRPEEGEALEASTSVHEGPLPVLLRGVAPEAEVDWIARFIRQMARHLHLRPSAAAVLVPAKAVGELLAEELDRAGLPARYFAGRELDLKEEVVRVLTLHSAKGLEFPIVAVAGWAPGTYPRREDYDDVGLFEERLRAERRLVYVGLTRAMRGLLLSVQRGCEHPALVDLDTSLWHVEEVT